MMIMILNLKNYSENLKASHMIESPSIKTFKIMTKRMHMC